MHAPRYRVPIRVTPDFLKLLIVAYVCAILTGMQPELSPGLRSMEQNPLPQIESYEVPQGVVTPEVLPITSPEYGERQGSAIELAPPPSAPLAPSVALPAPAPVAPGPAVDDAIMANPIAANDDDVIEKEWVDRAKQVILQTRDNPFAREKAIGELQRDYLMKRYGRQLGASND